MTGTYVSMHLTLECEAQLRQWIEEQNIPNQPYEPLHSTVVYCRDKIINWPAIVFDPPLEVNPETYEWKVFGLNSEILVLSFKHDFISERNNWGCKEFNYSWDFDEFIPHVTISYRADNFNYTKLPYPSFSLKFDSEVIEELNDSND